VTTITIVENTLIIVAEGFWILSNSSQLKRLVKTRNRKGLSAPNQTLNGAGNIAWATYFASRRLYVPMVTNLTMLVITATTLAYTLGNKKQFIRGLIAIAIVGPLTSYIIIVFPGVSGWVGVIYNAIASTPWLVHVIRTKKTSGISERSLFFSLGAIICTFTYALLITSAPLVVGCIVGLTTISVAMRYYYRYRYDN